MGGIYSVPLFIRGPQTYRGTYRGEFYRGETKKRPFRGLLAPLRCMHAVQILITRCYHEKMERCSKSPRRRSFPPVHLTAQIQRPKVINLHKAEAVAGKCVA